MRHVAKSAEGKVGFHPVKAFCFLYEYQAEFITYVHTAALACGAIKGMERQCAAKRYIHVHTCIN